MDMKVAHLLEGKLSRPFGLFAIKNLIHESVLSCGASAAHEASVVLTQIKNPVLGMLLLSKGTPSHRINKRSCFQLNYEEKGSANETI